MSKGINRAGLVTVCIAIVILVAGNRILFQPNISQKKQTYVVENLRLAEISDPIALPNSYDTKWGQDEESPFASFNKWAKERAVHAEAGTVDPVSQEELDMVIARREALLELIKKDPEAALKYSIPSSLRQLLPEKIQENLEQHISGVGDYTVIAIDYPLGTESGNLIDRWVRIDGKRFRTYVYGRREKHISKHNIPLHGIAIGNVMALHESPANWQEDQKNPDEI